MKTNDNRSILEWMVALAGAWIMVSAWIVARANPALVLSGAAQANHLLVGGAVVVLALAGVFAFRIWEQWMLALLGLWLIASPWLLGFSALVPLVVSDLVIGPFVVAICGWVVVSEEAAA